DQIRERLAHGTKVPQAHLANSQSKTTSSGAGISAQALTTGLCFRQAFSDPDEPDITELDATSFELGFDCPTGRWTFGITTVQNFNIEDVFAVILDFDTDNTPATGCDGAEWELLFGSPDPTAGPVSELDRLDSNCDVTSFTDSPVVAFDHTPGTNQ